MEPRSIKEIGIHQGGVTKHQSVNGYKNPNLKLQTRPLKLFVQKLPKRYLLLRRLILDMPDWVGYEYLGWVSALLKLMSFCDGEENRNGIADDRTEVLKLGNTCIDTSQEAVPVV